MKNKANNLKYSRLLPVFFLLAFAGVIRSTSYAGERLVVEMKDFTRMEVKTGGFTLPGDVRLHVHALGAGISRKSSIFSDDNMFAYGWIINADTREQV